MSPSLITYARFNCFNLIQTILRHSKQLQFDTFNIIFHKIHVESVQQCHVNKKKKKTQTQPRTREQKKTIFDLSKDEYKNTNLHA